MDDLILIDALNDGGVALEGGPSGNVIAYNFITDIRYKDPEWAQPAIMEHAAHPMMNLIEGNRVTSKLLADTYWGSGSHNTWYEADGDIAYDKDKIVYKLGFVDGSDSDADDNDPNVKETLLRHGNWDSVTMGAVGDPAIVEHTLPPSLYLAGKPEWLVDATFPVYGPESGATDAKIPAESRYP